MRRKAFVCSTAMWTAAGLTAEFPPLVAAAAAVQTLLYRLPERRAVPALANATAKALVRRRIEPVCQYTPRPAAHARRVHRSGVAAKASSMCLTPFASLRMTRATASCADRLRRLRLR